MCDDFAGLHLDVIRGDGVRALASHQPQSCDDPRMPPNRTRSSMAGFLTVGTGRSELKSNTEEHSFDRATWVTLKTLS